MFFFFLLLGGGGRDIPCAISTADVQKPSEKSHMTQKLVGPRVDAVVLALVEIEHTKKTYLHVLVSIFGAVSYY